MNEATREVVQRSGMRGWGESAAGVGGVDGIGVRRARIVALPKLVCALYCLVCCSVVPVSVVNGQETYRIGQSLGVRMAGGEEIEFRVDVPLGQDAIGSAQEQCKIQGHSDSMCEELVHSFAQEVVAGTTRGEVSRLGHGEAISVLFGMKSSFESFPEAAQAGMHLESFHGGVGDWWRFQEMLGEAATREGWPDYDLFSEDPLFHFTMPWATWGDAEAAELAKGISKQDADLLLYQVGDSTYGYREGRLQGAPGGVPDSDSGPAGSGVLPTSNTCRHAMHLSALLRTLRDRPGLLMQSGQGQGQGQGQGEGEGEGGEEEGEEEGEGGKEEGEGEGEGGEGRREKGRRGRNRLLEKFAFVEIGGGYGNMARLVAKAYGFKSWTILDLGFMGKLQKRYLEQTLGLGAHQVMVNGAASEVRSEQTKGRRRGGVGLVNLVDTRSLNAWYTRGLSFEEGEEGGQEEAGGRSAHAIDVLIATSSLSELAMDDFFWYYNHVVKHARFVLYAYNKGWPSPEIVEEKMDFLLKTHQTLHQHESANGQTVTCVLERLPA
jgi:hypothetical protein